MRFINRAKKKCKMKPSLTKRRWSLYRILKVNRRWEAPKKKKNQQIIYTSCVLKVQHIHLQVSNSMNATLRMQIFRSLFSCSSSQSPLVCALFSPRWGSQGSSISISQANAVIGAPCSFPSHTIALVLPRPVFFRYCALFPSHLAAGMLIHPSDATPSTRMYIRYTVFSITLNESHAQLSSLNLGDKCFTRACKIYITWLNWI